MEWIYVGVILNSILTSGFPTEEACLGHKAMLEKQKVYGVCVATPAAHFITGSSGTIFLGPNFSSCMLPSGAPCQQ